jgi:hypothetical protein
LSVCGSLGGLIETVGGGFGDSFVALGGLIETVGAVLEIVFSVCGSLGGLIETVGRVWRSFSRFVDSLDCLIVFSVCGFLQRFD